MLVGGFEIQIGRKVELRVAQNRFMTHPGVDPNIQSIVRRVQRNASHLTR